MAAVQPAGPEPMMRQRVVRGAEVDMGANLGMIPLRRDGRERGGDKMADNSGIAIGIAMGVALGVAMNGAGTKAADKKDDGAKGGE